MLYLSVVYPQHAVCPLFSVAATRPNFLNFIQHRSVLKTEITSLCTAAFGIRTSRVARPELDSYPHR